MVQPFTWALLLSVCLSGLARAADDSGLRPNILWLTSEDHGPHMGCYGDKYATTPNVDALAAKGLRYTHVWSNAPVCAPARTTLISGLYPPSTGSEHMRSMVPFPAGKQMFPSLLRAAGYYCTNNVKEDYNLTQPGVGWDASTKKAHWRSRKDGQPFFAVFNSTKSHESQVRRQPHILVHDPQKVRVPAYHPDTPVVRRDWAQYYDMVSQADADAGERLKELDADGLADDTIVFYFSDHGSGMPRNKRWLYNSGLQVPLVVFIPEKFRALRPDDYRAGGTTDRLVSFVDFAPTVLSVAGVTPPEWMQGHAFLGPFAAPPQPFVYGFRGRMDERQDMQRSATDGRYVYIRNYYPHRIYGQYLAYMWETPTTRMWKQLHDEGKLNKVQDAFWNTKPPEELYDLVADRDEVNNLSESAEHQESRKRLRAAQQALARSIRDVGFLPEGEMHRRSAGSTPYDMGHDDAQYPFEHVFAMAELASDPRIANPKELHAGLGDADSAVRYWAAVGLLIRGPKAVSAERDALVAALKDESPDVRVAAAEALAAHGSPADQQLGLAALGSLAGVERQSVFTAVSAWNALDALGSRVDEIRKLVRGRRTLLEEPPHPRYGEYVPRLLKGGP